MEYKIHMFIRSLYMAVFKKSCATCIYYDGNFGCDCCFKCERNKRAKQYVKRSMQVIK